MSAAHPLAYLRLFFYQALTQGLFAAIRAVQEVDFGKEPMVAEPTPLYNINVGTFHRGAYRPAGL